MDTSKQPPFPNPPLEWGIPQYPTPNVPDFYTKDGHIILVEKVSAEKGSYNPQPLDGSITYTKRDANKWPSTLYLVYQKPDETGQFVYNYYANDRTLASQDAWNFGLDYSANNPAFPITSRTYIVPRSQYATIPLGSTDPVFGGDQIVASQKKLELPDDNPLRSRYVAVQRVYETIPGPILEGARITERGDLETIQQQIVEAGASPDQDGLLVTQTSVQPVDSVKSTKTKGTVDSYATLTTKANKSGLLGNISTTDDIVAPSTDPDSLSTEILESYVEAISATKSRKRTTTANGPTLLSGMEYKSGLLGQASLTQSIVAYNEAPDSLSLSIISSSVDPIDEYKSKKTTIESDGPTLLGGKENKPGLLGVTSTSESIVSAGSSADVLSLSVLQSSITPIDSAKSKKTTTSSFGPTQLAGKTIGEFGFVSTEQSIVSYNDTLPTPTKDTIDLKTEPIDSAKAKLIEASYDEPEVLNGYQYDADLNLIVENKKEIIAEGADPLEVTDGLLAYSDTPINAWQSIRVQSKITSLPGARTEYKTASYASPNLLTGFNNSFFVFPDGTINYNVTPVMRSRRSYQTVFKFETSFSYGQPTQPTPVLFDPVSIGVSYRGFFFSIQLDDCLTDSGLSISFSTGTNTSTSAKYGSISETYNVPVSSTTASQYIALLGQYKTISYDVEYWKANIWRTSIASVLLK